MIDQEMLRNGSGYPDDTAYKAMTMAPKPGEIWERKANKDIMLVMAKNGNVYSCLRLCAMDGTNKIKVQAREMMYTNPVMLEYTFSQTLGVYVKTLPDDQFQEVRRAVAGVFGFDAKENEHDEPDMLGIKIELGKARGDFEALRKKANTRIEELENKCAVLEEAKRGYQEETGRIGVVADLYRELYEKLLDKVVSSRGGAVVE